jgi:phosphoglycolate phosphatase
VTKPLIVFDLDGTLIDGYDAIVDALGYAMERLGETPLPPAAVRRMVGQGLEVLLEQAVGPARAPEGVRLFRERYPQVAIEKSRLLPEIAEVLSALARRGHPMAVASNKPQRFSRLILDAKGIGGRLSAVAGPDDDTPPKPDPTMLRRILRELSAHPGDAVIVGDMEIDAQFARAAGCRVVLIPGGSRTREELAGVDADAFLESMAELPAWLDGNAPA